MRTVKYLLGALLIVGVSGALLYLYGGGEVPQGQHPLESLTPQNVADIRDAFNASKSDVKVLLLLSPT